MTGVFMPTNRRIRDIILSRADLLVDSKMPECLLQVCAHVAAYEALVAAWETGDFSEHKTSLRFPGAELLQYAQTRFDTLSAIYQALIGRVS